MSLDREPLEPGPRAAFLAALCDRFGVDVLYAFGSRATDVLRWRDGELRELPPSASDVDVGALATGGVPLDLEAKVALAQALEDALGVPRVDLVALADADPFLAANVVRGERLFARDADDADEYDLYVLRRAGDLAPFERERMRMILERR